MTRNGSSNTAFEDSTLMLLLLLLRETPAGVGRYHTAGCILDWRPTKKRYHQQHTYTHTAAAVTNIILNIPRGIPLEYSSSSSSSEQQYLYGSWYLLVEYRCIEYWVLSTGTAAAVELRTTMYRQYLPCGAHFFFSNLRCKWWCNKFHFRLHRWQMSLRPTHNSVQTSSSLNMNRVAVPISIIHMYVRVLHA